MDNRGLMHIYCGENKGKTTAAFGLALRCAGHGGRVLIVQFLKGTDSGEVSAAGRLPEIRVVRASDNTKFTFQMTDEERESVRRDNARALREAEACIGSGEFRLLVLDELIGAWNTELVDRKQVLALIDNRPEGVEVVLTGRDPAQALLDRADYVTEMKKIKHPFDREIPARRGIEF